MENGAVIYTQKDRMARITLNRPAEGNFITAEMAQELAELRSRINQDDTINVVVVTGAADKFCIGGESGASGNACGAAKAIAGIQPPVIAAINGDALGEGLELALACDIRIAAARAHFGLPQITQGRIPSDGGTQRLPRIVGRGKALEMILTGETVDAQTALKIGLVNRTAADDRFEAEIESVSRLIASKAPISLKYIKEAVNSGLDLTLEQGLGLEADLYFILHTTADRAEGIRAFREKREPVFRGE